MKLYKVNILLILPIFLLIAACSTIPRPTDPDSTLLVIHSVKEVGQRSSSGFNYWLVMEDDTRYSVRFDQAENYTFINNLRPGEIRTKLFQASLRGKTTSSSGNRYWNYPLRVTSILQSGSFTVFPAKIIYRENMGETGKFSFDILFEEIDAAELRKIRNDLEEKNLSDYWKEAK